MLKTMHINYVLVSTIIIMVTLLQHYYGRYNCHYYFLNLNTGCLCK